MTDTTMFTPTEPGTAFSSRVGALARARETGIILAVALVIIVTTIKNPTFLFSSDGWRDLLLTPSILVVVAIGEAIVIITRNVDLSVGSVLGLSAYLTGRLFIEFQGLPIVAVFVIVIVFGGLLGLINGALVAFARVPALVITLGTLYAYRGIDVAWAGATLINASDMPPAFLALGTKTILTIPVLTIIALVVLIIGAWYMKNLRGGREFYAIGSDPAAAELYGLAVTKRVLVVFIVSGAAAGLAGVLYAARYGTVNSQAGLGFELDAVAAAVIGCRIRRRLAADHQPRTPSPWRTRLLAARRGRCVDHRRHSARPDPRPPAIAQAGRGAGYHSSGGRVTRHLRRK